MTYVTGAAFGGREQELAEAIVARHYAHYPDLDARYGAVGRRKCVEDVVFHLLYLQAAVSAGSAQLFVDYIAWAKILFHKLGIDLVHLSATLDATADILQERVATPDAAAACAVIGQAQQCLPDLPLDLTLEVADNPASNPLARDFFHLLRARRRTEARQRILQAVESGTTVRDLYLTVFQPALRDIGRLWQSGHVSVAEEHYFTAATQVIMSQLYPYIFTERKAGPTMVSTCVTGELHEIGVRMLTDFFEMEGWDTHYLGANMPIPAIVETVAELQPKLLCVSVTITSHLGMLETLLQSVRALPEGPGIKVLVGGYPFNVSHDLWRRVGADGYAPDAAQALAVAGTLIGAPGIAAETAP